MKAEARMYFIPTFSNQGRKSKYFTFIVTITQLQQLEQ